MKSLFKKYMLTYGLVVILSFAVLGGAFLYQVNYFSVKEKRDLIDVTAQRVRDNTNVYYATMSTVTGGVAAAALENAYRINLSQLASYAGATIYISDPAGNIMRKVTPQAYYDMSVYREKIPEAAARQVAAGYIYSEIGTFSDQLEEASFTIGIPITDDYNQVYAITFVSVPAQASLDFFSNVVRTFLLLLSLVVLVTLFVTYLVVGQMVQPLRNMAHAARAFAHGDFSVRVELPRAHDEVYEMTDSFNDMADYIANTEDERRGLVANVSHDLRTPMTTISGFVDGILDGTIKPEKQEHYLRIISDEVKRLSRLANDMVELSQLQSSEAKLNIVNFDISEMTRRIVLSFEQKITDKNIEIELKVPERTIIAADRDAIFRVIYNLADNAVKFTKQDGKITINIRTTGGKLDYSIENTGDQIPPDEAKNVFERFYKMDKSRSENKKGAGLGLYIAKTIVNRHGGDIGVTSNEKTSKFYFDLPLKQLKNQI